jgi:alpha-glucosidase (family GH31 glycosyl hydrolase)
MMFSSRNAMPQSEFVSVTCAFDFSCRVIQCRWNYKDDGDVRAVDGGFDEHDIPYDVLWLDIEHTEYVSFCVWMKCLTRG